MDFNIIPECYVDTNLVETIAPPTEKRGYNHQKGCGTVAKKMQDDNALKDGFAVGIIDKDKKEIKYLNVFEEITNWDNQLKLLKHPQKHHYFIQIIPAIEKWILVNAQEVDIDLKEFDLPNEIEGLKKYAKRTTSKFDEKFRKLFRELKRREASGVMTLSKWIVYLKKENYKVDTDFFK
jgi:hypothetical protein